MSCVRPGVREVRALPCSVKVLIALDFPELICPQTRPPNRHRAVRFHRAGALQKRGVAEIHGAGGGANVGHFAICAKTRNVYNATLFGAPCPKYLSDF